MTSRARARKPSFLAEYSSQLGIIVRRQRTEAALVAAKVEAESANRAKSEFLANMSHELRTPLNAIIGFSEIMRDGLLGPERLDKYQEYSGDIFSSANHLLSIINDILDLSKIETGKLELDCEEVLVSLLVDSCVRLMAERAVRANVKIIVDIESENTALYVDLRKMKQILINLLSNSVKFTLPGGTITIRGRGLFDKRYELVVVDTGIGMNPADIPRALEPFSQVDSRLNRKYEGTGLGLPLSKAFAELHGAAFILTSAPDIGTQAAMIFPADRVTAVM